MNAAQDALKRIVREYTEVFRERYSYHNIIINMPTKGLEGVLKIQKMVGKAYSGSREISFKRSMEDTLTSIKTKIIREETKLSNCQSSIASIKTKIETLSRSLLNAG